MCLAQTQAKIRRSSSERKQAFLLTVCSPREVTLYRVVFAVPQTGCTETILKENWSFPFIVVFNITILFLKMEGMCSYSGYTELIFCWLANFTCLTGEWARSCSNVKLNNYSSESLLQSSKGKIQRSSCLTLFLRNCGRKLYSCAGSKNIKR